MTTIELDDDVARRLSRIAREQRRSVTDLMRSLVEAIDHPLDERMSEEANRALAEMAGMFDDADVTDLSVTVRDTMDDFYRRKYGNPD